MDAVIVGVGTVLTDNPQLTARPPGPRTAIRVILDSNCRLPADSALAKSAAQRSYACRSDDSSAAASGRGAAGARL